MVPEIWSLGKSTLGEGRKVDRFFYLFFFVGKTWLHKTSRKPGIDQRDLFFECFFFILQTIETWYDVEKKNERDICVDATSTGVRLLEI